MSVNKTFDQIWEEKYARGHSQLYPWDSVVSFVFRHAPRDKPRERVRILEVGCGTASNLWFAAREGFQVTGIDASESAITTARARFKQDGLAGDLRAQDFSAKLPFNDGAFDLVIDRCALTCCGYSVANAVIEEIHRVTARGGKFFFNPYSEQHSSYATGIQGEDGLVLNITAGTLVNAGQICFYGRQQVENVLPSRRWHIASIQHLVSAEMIAPQYLVHAEWRVIAEKQSSVPESKLGD